MELGKSRKSSLPSPASTTSKGVQKFYTKIRHKIEDLPPKITAKLHKTAKHSSTAASSPNGKFTSLGATPKPKPKVPAQKLVTKSVQTSPIKDTRKTKDMVKSSSTKEDSVYEEIQVVSSNPNGSASIVYVDSDEECRLSLNDSKISLEDEIFEELEKVAHDEAKLKAVLKNFDKILTDFTENKQVAPKSMEYKSLNISLPIVGSETANNLAPKKLQKSKTCSIIESRCILKKTVSDPKDDIDKLSLELRRQAHFNTTKSLWNLKDFEEFAKSGKKLEKFENCKLPVYTGLNKSIGSATEQRLPAKVAAGRSKSVWELSGSTQSIVASRSKIPIMKASSIKSLSSRSNSFCDVPQKTRSPPSVSKIVKNINEKSPGLPKPFSRATSSLAASTSKLSPIGFNQQRRKSLAPAVSTPHSLNRVGGMSALKTTSVPKSTIKSASSEVSLKRFTPPRYAPLKKQQSSDVLLDKCLEKGHEILRKVEAFGSVTKLDRKQRSPSIGTFSKKSSPSTSPVGSISKKSSSISPRSYARIKEQSSAKTIKEKNLKTAANKIAGKITTPSTNNSKELNKKHTKPQPVGVSDTQSLNNERTSITQVTIDTTPTKPLTTPPPQPEPTLLYAKEESVKFPRLESCKIIPPILGKTSEEHAELLVNVKTKQADLKPPETTILIDKLCNGQLELLENVDKDLYPDSDHDSDDSGHISNENDELLTITSGDCGSSRTSSSDSCKEASPPPTSLMTTASVQHQRVAASAKISELLEKFEHNNNSQRQHQHQHHHQLQIPSKKICTAMKIAEVEPVKCIQTHIEIYPTYSKEVILRLL